MQNQKVTDANLFQVSGEDFMGKKINLKLSGNDFYCTNAFLLLINIMLCMIFMVFFFIAKMFQIETLFL